MKKILAVLFLLFFGLLNTAHLFGQDKPKGPVASTVVKEVVTLPEWGTDEWKQFKKDVENAQALNQAGKFQEAVDAAPLSYQKAWYSLSVLREKMGGTREASGYWEKYNFDKKGKFAGDTPDCLKQIEVVRGYVQDSLDQGYRDKVTGISAYLNKYESNIKNGLDIKPKDSDTSSDD